MTVFIAICSLLVLVILHELGHFLVARKFDVEVEEFGVGIPPRLWGKKFGETLYSLNLLPLGAFVRMKGEEARDNAPRSFSSKPVWQRFLIVGGGVAVFWVIAAVLLGVLAGTTGIPAAFADDAENVKNPQVRIVEVAADSPASAAGVQIGDIVQEVHSLSTGEEREISKVGHLQEAVERYAGTKIVLLLQRGKEVMELELVPREDPPAEQGAIGVGLVRVGLFSVSWYEAPWQGVQMTGKLTGTVVMALGTLAGDLFGGKGMPPGVELRGPIGIVELAGDAVNLGAAYFFYFVALIAIYLAIFNTLPIPALDGGRMFFLVLEAVRKKPLSERTEHRAVAVSFGILLVMLLAVSAMDIFRFF
ncbi:M50 family metallopeptidase [Patescibacteria group bacterium]|nr:M50 family metallopeptidase [Patescibacteria group bacterium]